MDKLTQNKIKSSTLCTYDALGGEYDSWYISKASKELRETLSELTVQKLSSKLSMTRVGNKKAQILDLCCGTGQLYPWLSKLGEYTGADFAPGMIACCKNRYPDGRFELKDAEDLDYPDSSFDAVVCFWSFHHITNPKKAISEISRVLKPKGMCLIVTFDSTKNPLALAGDVMADRAWGFKTFRHSEKEFNAIMQKDFKSVDIQKYCSKRISLLSALGIRFLIISAKKA